MLPFFHTQDLAFERKKSRPNSRNTLYGYSLGEYGLINFKFGENAYLHSMFWN
eukprot:UN08980